MKKIIFLGMVFLLLVGCTSQETKKSSEMTLRVGTVAPLEMSTWMYGTNMLTKDSKIVVSLIADKNIKLDDYNGKKVEVTGELKEGYPIDGGPEYLEVKTIKIIK